MKKFIFLFLLAIVFATGCSPAPILDDTVPEDADHIARKFLTMLHDGSIDEAVEIFDPKLNKGEKFRNELIKLSGQLSGSFDEVRLVQHGRIQAMINDNAQTRITYEILTAKGRFVTNIAVSKNEGVLLITGLYLEELDKPLEEITRFTFEGKSTLHYVFFALALLVPIIALYGMYLAYCSGTHLRWLWMICMLPGTGNVSLNWTSGHFSSNAFSISTLWAPFIREGLSGATYISLALPFVAGIYIYRYWKANRHPVNTSAGRD